MTAAHLNESLIRCRSWLPAIVLAGWAAILVWLVVTIFAADEAPEIGYVGTYLFFAFFHSAYYFAAVGFFWIVRWYYRDSKRRRQENEA